MFNPVIIIAIFVQAIVSRFSRIAGAIIGYIVTTGILLWGLSVYAGGNQIALGGIPLSRTVFLIACLVWFGLDTSELLIVRKQASLEKNILQSPLLQDEKIIAFYQATLKAWSAGTLSVLGKGFKNEGKLKYEDFLKKYLPFEGSALHAFFTGFQPLDGEFLIGLGNQKKVGWCLLTNLRLIQKDGRDNCFKEVCLSNMESYQVSGKRSKTLVIKMKSGEEITFEKVKMYITENFLTKTVSMASQNVNIQ